MHALAELQLAGLREQGASELLAAASGEHLDIGSRRVRTAHAGIPARRQTRLMFAAAEQPGSGNRLWSAAVTSGVRKSAAVPAEAMRLTVFWPAVRFEHP